MIKDLQYVMESLHDFPVEELYDLPVEELHDLSVEELHDLPVEELHDIDVTNEIKLHYFCVDIKQAWVDNVVTFIHDNPTLVDKLYNKTTPLLVAIMTNQLHMVQLLVDTHVDVNNPHGVTTPLVAAVLMDNASMAEVLIAHGACIEGGCGDNPALQTAQQTSQVENFTAIHAAIEMDNQPMAEWLLQQITRIDTSVLVCAVKSSLSMVNLVHQKLLQCNGNGCVGVGVGVGVDMGIVLRCATKENCLYSVTLLVQSPLVGTAVLSNPSMMDYAIQHGNTSIMDVLGRHGANFCI